MNCELSAKPHRLAVSASRRNPLRPESGVHVSIAIKPRASHISIFQARWRVLAAPVRADTHVETPVLGEKSSGYPCASSCNRCSSISPLRSQLAGNNLQCRSACPCALDFPVRAATHHFLAAIHLGAQCQHPRMSRRLDISRIARTQD